MTCLVNRFQGGGAGNKSHTSMLGRFFIYLGTMYADIQQFIQINEQTAYFFKNLFTNF